MCLLFYVLCVDAPSIQWRCIPYNFCCFRGVYVDKRFVIDKVIDNIITVEHYARKKLVLGSPPLPSSNVKKTAICINWLNYHEIRRKVNKYTKEHNSWHKSTIKDDVLFLLSRFTAKDIKIALSVTLSKLDISFPGLDKFPLRKNKLIESFSQLIYDRMLILWHSVKAAERYVLQLLCIAYLPWEYIHIQSNFLIPCRFVNVCNFTSCAFEIIVYLIEDWNWFCFYHSN